MNEVNAFPSRVWAEIDLDRLEHNYRYIRGRLHKEMKMLSVIKADAYGHGAVEVARRLVRCGVDLFGVAVAEEGVKLRENGIRHPILLLGITGEEYAGRLLEYDIMPSVSSLGFARALNEFAGRAKKKVKVHIRVDVSGSSIGIAPQDCLSFVRKIESLDWLEVEGIYCHCASFYGGNIEDQENDRRLFVTVTEQLNQNQIHIPLAHAVSSPAIFNWPENGLNMVRTGILLYGMPATKKQQTLPIKPVMQFKSKVAAIKKVAGGSRLGYGYRETLNRDMILAIIPAGYADASILYNLKNGEVLIGGKRAPIVGQVFMDHFMIDVSRIDHVNVNDEVVLFGEQLDDEISTFEVVERAGMSTMNCDIPCLLSARVPRVYKNREKHVYEEMRQFG